MAIQPQNQYIGRTKFQSLSVLFVVHGFPSALGQLGGTELYSVNLARQMQANETHVAILYPLYDDDPETHFQPKWSHDAGIDVIVVTLPRKRDVFASLTDAPWIQLLASKISEKQFDIVHFQHMGGGIAPILAKSLMLRHHQKLFLTLHDGNIICEQNHFMHTPKDFCEGPTHPEKCGDCLISRNGIQKDVETTQFFSKAMDFRIRLMRLLTSKMEAVIVPTHFLKSRMSQYKFSIDNVIQRPLGLNFFPVESKQKTSKLRLSFIGNLTFTKGIDILLDAFFRIETQSAELHIHGANHASLPEIEDLDRLRANHIFYHGPYAPSSLAKILGETDVGIVPSRSDNFPTVVREFLHAGIPVVGSDAGGVPELVIQDINGRIFPSQDVDALKFELERLIEDPDILEKYKSNIKPQFNIETDASELLTLYREALKT